MSFSREHYYKHTHTMICHQPNIGHALIANTITIFAIVIILIQHNKNNKPSGHLPTQS